MKYGEIYPFITRRPLSGSTQVLVRKLVQLPSFQSPELSQSQPWKQQIKISLDVQSVFLVSTSSAKSIWILCVETYRIYIYCIYLTCCRHGCWFVMVIWNLGPRSEELYSHLQAHLLRFCLTSTRYDTVECTSLVQRKYLCSVLLKYAQIRSDTPHSVQTKWLFTKAVACFQLSSQRDRPGRLPELLPALGKSRILLGPWRLAWMHHGTLKQKYMAVSLSTWLCLKKKVYHGVPVFPQLLAIVIGKMMMGVPYFQTNPHDLPDLLVLQLPLPICRAPPVSQLCELWLCQPSSCGQMMDTPRETCNIPILWLFRYRKWWSTIGFRYRENPFLHKPTCDISYSIIRLQTKLHWDFACCFSILFDVFRSNSEYSNPPMKIHHHQTHLVQYWRVHTGLHPWSIGHTAGCTRHAWRRKPCGNGGWDPPDFWLKWRRKWWKNNGGEVADLIFVGDSQFLGIPNGRKTIQTEVW